MNPRKSVQQILEKPFHLHRELSTDALRTRVLELLDDVGLVPALDFIGRYPHQLSGGQRQRLVIARAVALEPELIVADEPVSALDVSVRAQILNLLKRLQAKYGLTMIFISHDLSVVRALCSRVAVMYLGKIVETGDTRAIYDAPLHPYTRALIAATRFPTPGKCEREPRFCWKATYRARSKGRPAAPSIRDVSCGPKIATFPRQS